MTTDDNSTSPPWLQNHAVDLAAEKDDSTSKPAHDDQAEDSATGGDAERDTLDDDEQGASGIFPPVPDSIEQTTFQPGPFAPPPGFAPPGPPPTSGPFAGSGPFAPQPGGFPAPDQPGPWGGPPPGGPGDPNSFGPGGPGDPNSFGSGGPGDPNSFAPGGPGEPNSFGPRGSGDPNSFGPGGSGDPNAFGAGGPGEQNSFGPGFGEVRQETPYGEIRQEIGPDGMVRRVFPEDGGQPAPQPEQPGEQYSWAPPPLPPTPQPQQQMYSPPPMQQPGPPGWGGPNPQPPQPHSSFQPQHAMQPGQPHSVSDLNLLKRARKAPRSGWRRAVHKVTGGAINPGESPADVVHRELVERVNQPVRGDYRIAILSLKGGVGKTTTTVGLGSTFSSLRGDRVIAIDANPDLGTLAHRVPRQTRSTVRNLLEDQHISRYSDVRAHTSQAPSRLEVLASEQDPAVSEAFSEDDYRRAIAILQQFYNIILTDCGTGLMHSAMKGVLDMASSLILVTSPAIDGARSASATLDWLEHHGYGKLVERTVVVVNASRRGASTVDLDQLRKLFLDRTRAVQVVPFDDHLAEGAEIDLELVGKPTRRALLELAAMVADDFGYHVPQPPFPSPQTHYPGHQGPYPGNPYSAH
ncbi:AAA family ATPase [Nocardia transvalensis]|uniref:nucleotide-binding protein n=1 Tax=Nocardia transvalensis TaxID=37333 RepID=UPI0018949CD0|nr:MinD/ParA family protein [Nocardia transvalensis]MBF6333395.1 MinD/ParA family protein [Nocardia transvalensis]